MTIEERPIIKEIEFTGNKKLSSSQIRDVLKEDKTEVKVGAPLSLRDIARARAVIAEAYIAQGFRSATVDYKIEDLSKTEKKVIFMIDEGDKVKIESISFTGNANVSAQTLRNAMHKTKVAVFWRILSDNTVYSQANYEADVESLKAVYQARGYKDIVIKDPILDVYVVNPDAKPNKIKRRVRLTIPIVEGDKFFTNDITVVAVRQNGQPTESGQTEVFPPEQLRKQFYDLSPGSVLNRDRIIEGLALIETMYKSRGFIYSYPNPVFKELPDHRGGHRGPDLRGRQVLSRPPGGAGKHDDPRQGHPPGVRPRRGRRLRHGSGQEERHEDPAARLLQDDRGAGSSAPLQEEKKVDIVIKGQETSRNEIQFGAGYSGFDGFFGQFSFQTRNFLGRGEIIGASAQLGKVSNFFDLSYTVPWFMDRNQSVGARALPPATSTTSRRKRSGWAARCSTRKGLSLFDSVSMLYAYEDITANFPVRSAPDAARPAGAAPEVHRDDGHDLLADAGLPLRQPQRSVRPDAGLPPLRRRSSSPRARSEGRATSSRRSAAPRSTSRCACRAGRSSP